MLVVLVFDKLNDGKIVGIVGWLKFGGVIFVVIGVGLSVQCDDLLKVVDSNYIFFVVFFNDFVMVVEKVVMSVCEGRKCFVLLMIIDKLIYYIYENFYVGFFWICLIIV